MKDGRNLINLLAVINVLKEISDYQEWGQREKASAFERKYARQILKTKLENLEDPKNMEKIIDKEFSFIDFEQKKMKNCGEKISFLPSTKKEFVKLVMKRQKMIGDAFLKNKDENS